MQDTVWMCRDGKPVLVSQMDDRHLDNAIAMILNGRGWREKYLDRLQLELVIRAIKRQQSK